jgi:uracil-DNA glycosylase family 4
MKGFFNRSETQLLGMQEGSSLSCISCGRYKSAINPKLAPSGKGNAGLVVIDEAPSIDNDRKHVRIGGLDSFINQTYSQVGIDLQNDAMLVHAVNCWSGSDPTSREIACCRLKVVPAIKQAQPKVIIVHGEKALESVIGHRWKGSLGGISKWQGWSIPDREWNAWVCPTFTPSYVKQEQDRNKETEVPVIWRRDIQNAISLLDVPFPAYKDEATQIEIVEEPRLVRKLLKDLNRQTSLLAFDIEATGLRPFNISLHEIACISFCNNDDVAYVIPAPKDTRTIQLLTTLLENPAIPKTAANMKYENLWMDVMYNIHVTPWQWDTMLAAHLLDNRPGVTGLKFQAYVNFGTLGYEQEINPFLESPDSTVTNRVMELMADRVWRHKLMTYCGIDSLVERRLAVAQMRKIQGGPTV